MDQNEFGDWLASYRDAWEAKDPAAAGALFSADAQYRVTPFDEPLDGRGAIEEYWADVTAGQTDPSVEVAPISYEGDTGVGQFNAQFADPDGGSVELDGVCVVTFEDDVASEFLEWWHMRED